MKELVVNIAPFVLKQTIFIREDGKVSQLQIPQKEIASYISLHTDIDVVHLFGPEKFTKKIHEECITKYSVNNIDFKFKE